MNFEAGYLVGEFVGALLFGTALSILASFLFRRFVAPSAMIFVSVIVGFAATAALMVLNPKGGPSDWTALLPVTLAALVVFLIWRWRLALRDGNEANG